MGANELSASLWRERNLFEILEYKLEVEHLLLAAGNSKWIGRVTDEIDDVVGALRKLNLIRDLEIERLADEWDISGRASLREIVQAAPDAVWADIFGAHLGALLELAGRIRTLEGCELADAPVGHPFDAGDNLVARRDPAAPTIRAVTSCRPPERSS